MLRHAQVTGMNNPVEEAACAEAGINMHIKNEDRGHCGWRGRALQTDLRDVLTKEGEISCWLGDREYVQEKKQEKSQVLT